MADNRGAPESCYACARPAITKEHAPPLCFFPEAKRNNLITVPSCLKHNNANSKDVEYVRNVLVSTAQLGPESQQVFSKALRAMERRPALLATTFPEINVIQFKGQETGAFEIDLGRLRRVMTAIVQALHFRETGVKRRKWRVFSPSLHSAETLAGRFDDFEPLRVRLATLPYQYAVTGHQEVFVYGTAERPGTGRVYQLVFYDAVIINAWRAR